MENTILVLTIISISGIMLSSVFAILAVVSLRSSSTSRRH